VRVFEVRAAVGVSATVSPQDAPIIHVSPVGARDKWLAIALSDVE
jgi:hypothetical protein